VLGFHQLSAAFRRLEIDPSRPVIAHSSLSAFGQVQGDAGTLVGALLSSFNRVMMPAFTYKTMLIPEVGPPDNAMLYGSGADTNLLSQVFHADIPVDRLIGATAETLRKHPQAHRSSHPILSFTGVNVDAALQAQTIAEPLAPIRTLLEDQGWCLLLGVEHNVNTSLHYAEHLAGRKSFTRWALTQEGVVECPMFPGCSDGFPALEAHLGSITRRISVGDAIIKAIPACEMVDIARQLILADPLALLCPNSYCERCSTTRAGVISGWHPPA